jgi:DNA repair ATPase RecN
MDIETARYQGDRIGALEQDMQVVKWRLIEVERRHDSSPERLAKVEQVMAYQSEKLDDMEQGITRIQRSVERMGTKITLGFGAAATVMMVLDKAWPFIVRGLS